MYLWRLDKLVGTHLTLDEHHHVLRLFAFVSNLVYEAAWYALHRSETQAGGGTAL
jgi:hypothetical protein